ncbi:MAG: DHA2 family efflux MFS transporter permease subunit [Acidobacteriota bacterium]
MTLTMPARPANRKVGSAWVLAATILGSSMAFIDGTVVNVALPAIQAEFRATLVDVQWIVEAYALLLAALLLAGGSLGDRFGRRRVFAAGTLLFAGASVWCGLAPDVRHLIAARGVQGAGGALLVPGSLAILASSFSNRERGRAIGTWSGFTAITAAAGPVLGGWLIDHLSWRWAFFINVPLAAAVLVITFRRVPESRDEAAKGRVDWPGATLATLGLGGLVYALIESSDLGWRHPAVLAALAGGVLSIALFVLVEQRAEEPMLPMTLFSSRDFTGANLLTLFLYTALSGVFFFLPLNLIQVQGYSAAKAGAALLPFILLMFLLSRWSGGLFDRIGAKIPLVAGPAVASAGFALFALPGVGGSYWTTFFPAMVVLGLGMATSVAPLTTTVMSSVEGRHAGAASGINNAVSRTAGLISVAVLSLVMLSEFRHGLHERLSASRVPPELAAAIESQSTRLAAIELPAGVPAAERDPARGAITSAFLGGFRRVMWIGAGLALLAALTALALIKGRVRGGRRPLPAR